LDNFLFEFLARDKKASKKVRQPPPEQFFSFVYIRRWVTMTVLKKSSRKKWLLDSARQSKRVRGQSHPQMPEACRPLQEIYDLVLW
jgi:hypothetical protein